MCTELCRDPAHTTILILALNFYTLLHFNFSHVPVLPLAPLMPIFRPRQPALSAREAGERQEGALSQPRERDAPAPCRGGEANWEVRQRPCNEHHLHVLISSRATGSHLSPTAAVKSALPSPCQLAHCIFPRLRSPPSHCHQPTSP